MFIQDLWCRQFGWDEHLLEELQDEWKTLAAELATLSQIKFPRCITTSNHVSLHIFCDSSNRAYRAALYLSNNEKLTEPTLVMAKAQVASVKVISVPKLELTALLLAARLCNYVLDSYKDELNVEDITIWSDSQVTLTWLKYERSFHVYIGNRIEEIYQLVPPGKLSLNMYLLRKTLVTF